MGVRYSDENSRRRIGSGEVVEGMTRMCMLDMESEGHMHTVCGSERVVMRSRVV